MSLPELLNEMTGGNSGAITHINQVSGMDNLETTKLSSIYTSPNRTFTQPSGLVETDVNTQPLKNQTPETAAHIESPFE